MRSKAHPAHLSQLSVSQLNRALLSTFERTALIYKAGMEGTYRRFGRSANCALVLVTSSLADRVMAGGGSGRGRRA